MEKQDKGQFNEQIRERIGLQREAVLMQNFMPKYALW